MEIGTEKIATAPHVAYAGETFRHMAKRWDDPLSGDGARIRGGRFNPPDSFPVLYLCTTRPCTVAELRQLGRRQPIGVEGLLPRVLYRYQTSLDLVLDLTSDATLEHLGVSRQQVIGSDLTIPRQIGESAHAAGSQAIRAPSATGVDQVIAVFPELLGSGRWAEPGSLTRSPPGHLGPNRPRRRRLQDLKPGGKTYFPDPVSEVRTRCATGATGLCPTPTRRSAGRNG